MAVRVTAGSAEQVPIQRAPHVASDRVPVLLRIECDRVVFVDRLAVEHGFRRDAIVVCPGLIVAAGILRRVAILAHVYVEPWRLLGVLRGAAAAGRMERDEMRSAVAGAQAAGHRLDDGALSVALDRAVAAQDPDESRVAIPPPEPFAVRLGVRRCEDLRPHAPSLVPLV